MSDETDWRAQGYALPPNEFSPEPEKPVPTGLQKLPRTWAYLTRGARPPEPTVDAFDNPITETVQVKPAPGKTPEGERSAFTGDWPDGDAPAVDPHAFDAADFFNWMPPDLPISHGDRPIIESFGQHMSPHGMSQIQMHAAIRFGNGFEGDDADMFDKFVEYMEPHGLTRSLADQVKVWFTEYASSEEALDDAAVAEVDAAIARIEAKMGTREYIKSEKMQEAYRILLDVRDGDGEA